MSLPKEEKKATRAWPVMRAYVKAAGEHPWLVLISFVTGILIEGASVIAPLYLKDIVNVLATSTPATVAFASLAGILGMFAFAILVRWMSGNVQGTVVALMEARVMVKLEREAFRYLLGHSHDFFASNFAGALTRRVSRYARAFEQIFDTLIFNFFSTAIFAGGAIFVLFQRSPLLGAILLAWTVAFIALQLTLIRWKQPVRIASSAADTEVTAVLSDAISNQSTINQFSAATHEHVRFERTMEKWRVATVRSWITDTWINGALGFLVVTVQIGLLGGALYLWTRGMVTVGDFLLIQIYVISLIDRIWGIGRNMRRIFEAFADAHEMVVILERRHDIEDIPRAVPLQVNEGTIEMREVAFSFTPDRPILKRFSLSIQSGEKIALVGHSGAGKSTVTKLLLRLYDVTQGSIEIDGQDIAKVTQESLREAIAFVPQEPILFHRSLVENIRYGRRDASDEEVIEAAKKARCHDFIAKLPQGYETFVGERGVKLSGGERQRVAIARAILKNAPILILDEATSSLDSESEHLIQEALQILMEGKTVVVIAHRLSTIMHMDRIIVVENGRIAASGTHDELLDQEGGLYHKLWSIQAGSFIADA